jgi:Cu/Ag efflux protein CusF
VVKPELRLVDEPWAADRIVVISTLPELSRIYARRTRAYASLFLSMRPRANHSRSPAIRMLTFLQASVLLALLASACARSVQYTAFGEVVSIDEPRLHVTIRHEDIPGLMAAMTMRFAVASQSMLDGIAQGDAVRIVLVQRGGELKLVSIARR